MVLIRKKLKVVFSAWLLNNCHHEYQTSESYQHAINGLLHQIHQARLLSPGVASLGNVSGAIPLCQTLPSVPINPELAYQSYRRG